MAEAADTYGPNPLRDSDADTSTASATDEVVELSAEETAHLLELRQRVTDGDVHEWTGDYKRLRFARWLYEHGDLQS